MRAIWTTLVATGVIVAAAPVGPALAAGFTLNLSARAPPGVGDPMPRGPPGTAPAESAATPYFFSLDVFPASVATTCPAGQPAAAELVAGSGGPLLAASRR